MTAPEATATGLEQSMATSTSTSAASNSAGTPPSPETALKQDVQAIATNAKMVAELQKRVSQLEAQLRAAAAAAPHAPSAQAAIIQEGQRVESELSHAQHAAAIHIAATDAAVAKLGEEAKMQAKRAHQQGPKYFLVALLPPETIDDENDQSLPLLSKSRTLVKSQPYFEQLKAALEHCYAQVLASVRASAGDAKNVSIVISGKLNDGTELEVRDQDSLEYYYTHIFAAASASTSSQAASGRDEDEQSLAPSDHSGRDSAFITARLMFEDADLAQHESSGTHKSPVGAADHDEAIMGIQSQSQQLRWTNAEVYLFEKAVKKFGRSWTRVATEIPSRTARQIGAFAQTQLGQQTLAKIDESHFRGIAWNYAEAMNVFAKTIKRDRDWEIRGDPQRKRPYQRSYQHRDSFDDSLND